MRVSAWINLSIDYITLLITSLWGPPVNKVADEKAKEILDNPNVFWYMIPNRLGTPAWHYGNLLTAKLEDGKEANFLIDGKYSLDEYGSFYFFDKPNKRLRLHWKTQFRILYKAYLLKTRNLYYRNKRIKDQAQEEALLTEERISHI